METYHAIEMVWNAQWLDKLMILIGYEQLHLKMVGEKETNLERE